MRTIASTILVALVCVSSANAQSPRRPIDVSLSAGLAGAMLADEATSIQLQGRCPSCRELGLSTGPRLALKGSVFALIEWGKHRYPKQRKPFWIVQGVLIGVYSWAAMHNHGVRR